MAKELRIGIAAPAATARTVIDRLRERMRRGRAAALAESGHKDGADLAGHYGLVFFASVEEMIRSGEIDSLIVALDQPELEKAATAAVRNGMPVLCFTPAAMRQNTSDCADGRAIIYMDSEPATIDTSLQEWIDGCLAE